MLVQKKVLLIIFLCSFQFGCSSGSEEEDNNESANAEVSTQSETWLIPAKKVLDGGPGKDGIPSIDAPEFVAATSEFGQTLSSQALVVGILLGSQARAYPHVILDWHEIVNDFTGDTPIVLSYCPLTGSAIAWQSPSKEQSAEFGVSGLLYNSNLILYDRETDSNWSQMLQKSVNGERAGEDLSEQQLLIIETTWSQWQTWFPNTQLMSTNTGFSRNYGQYPYGDYLTRESTLFLTDNSDDKRLHPKSRAIGVMIGEVTKVYQISDFAADIQVVNDEVGEQNIVVIGSSGSRFGIAFSSELEGEILHFVPAFDDNQFHIQDQHGQVWDLLGRGVSEAVSGKQLPSVSHYTAFWFAWTAFFDSVQIHEF